MITFILITNDPQVAEYAERCGVGRIFVDLEVIGKQQRQGHLDTLMSRHSMDDIAKVKAKLTCADLLVRLNPMHSGTEAEIEAAIIGGAELLMLPMFRTADEVREFCKLVRGRAKVVPLVETYEGAMALSEIVNINGVTEIYIGLNDLHLDMKLSFMFEPLANGFVDKLVAIIKASGKPFGFGGIARYGEGLIPGEMVLGEHFRLGSSSVILSRTFHRKSENLQDFLESIDLSQELSKLNSAGVNLIARSSKNIEADYYKLSSVVENLISEKKK